MAMRLPRNLVLKLISTQFCHDSYGIEILHITMYLWCKRQFPICTLLHALRSSFKLFIILYRNLIIIFSSMIHKNSALPHTSAMVAKSIDERLVLEVMLTMTIHYVSCSLSYAQRWLIRIEMPGRKNLSLDTGTTLTTTMNPIFQI